MSEDEGHSDSTLSDGTVQEESKDTGNRLAMKHINAHSLENRVDELQG